MSARVRKFIGLFAILVFVAAYAVIAAQIGERLPDNMLVQTLFYVVAGLGWGLPILPLIRWMNRGR